MTASVPARLALAAGFLAAAIAYGAYTATRTALDPDATSAVAEKVLDSSLVHEHLVDELKQQVQEAAASESIPPDVAQAIDNALDDPRLVDAFRDAMTALHRALLEGQTGEITLDVKEVTNALQDALGPIDPALAAQLATAEPIRIDLGDADIPAFSKADDRARQILFFAALFAVGLLALAVALHESQRVALGRVGRRLAYLAIGPAIGFLLLPWLLNTTDNDGAQLVSSVLGVYAGRVLPSAGVLAVGGFTLWIATRLWPRPSVAEPAAAAAPGADPPHPYATKADPSADRPTEKLYL